MSLIKEKNQKIGNDLFKNIIFKKNKLNISSYQICLDLELDEEMVADYFLGKSKDNLFLGIEILNYLEKKEENQ